MSEGEDLPGEGALFPEDTVLYRLYPVESPESGGHDYVTELAVECMHCTKSLTTGHMWHYDPFRLAVWPGVKGR